MRSAAAAPESSPFLSAERWIGEKGRAPLLPVCSEVTQVVHKERQPGSQVSYRTWHALKTINGQSVVRVERQIK